MQLIPGRTFTIVRQIGNHTDAATYYVQAVIRNAYTDATIATVQLTDKGSQRFKYDWLVPFEPSGLGAFISIVTSVYTSSAYTTKSENYSDEENTYLWATLPTSVGGGGFSEKFDYRRVRDIVESVIKEIPKDGVLDALAEVRTLIDSLPKEKVDTEPILNRIETVLSAIEDKPVTPKTDLSPVLSAIAEKEVTPKTDLSFLQSSIKNLQTNIGEDFGEVKRMIDEAGKASEVVDITTKKMSELLDKTSFVATFAAQPVVGGKLLPRHEKMMEENVKAVSQPREESKEPEIDHDAIAKQLSQ